jgi:uncharacterized protein
MKARMREWIAGRPVIAFFVLTYAIMYVTVFTSRAVQGPGNALGPYSVPWFLAIFSPSISALAISAYIGGKAEVKRLLSGFTRWKVGAWPYLAAFALFGLPIAIALVYRAAGGAIPGVKPGLTALALAASVFFTFLSGPLAEEAGWRGFALPRLQARFGALTSSLILGVVWTCWHIPFYFLTGPSSLGIPFPIYLALVTTIGIFLTWLYNNTGGSLIVTVLAHFAFNLNAVLITGSLGMLPMNVFYMTAAPGLFIAVVIIVIVYGPKYLSRKPVAELPFTRG